MNNVYKISFLEPRAHWNWVSVSSISKEVFLGFIYYLYNLNRDIEILPYIPGGLVAGMGAKPHMDKTYMVRKIVRNIKNKEPIEEIFEDFSYIYEDDNKAKIYFIEDVYEMLLSFGLTQEDAVEIAKEQYCNSKIRDAIPICVNSELLETFIGQLENSGYYPYHSGWTFIYMFRGEFIRYMKSLGYDDVSVDGGWVLNDKKREVELGLIDEDGQLLMMNNK